MAHGTSHGNGPARSPTCCGGPESTAAPSPSPQPAASRGAADAAREGTCSSAVAVTVAGALLKVPRASRACRLGLQTARRPRVLGHIVFPLPIYSRAAGRANLATLSTGSNRALLTKLGAKRPCAHYISDVTSRSPSPKPTPSASARSSTTQATHRPGHAAALASPSWQQDLQRIYSDLSEGDEAQEAYRTHRDY